MRPIAIAVLCILCSTALCTAARASGFARDPVPDTCAPALREAVRLLGEDDTIAVWVFFERRRSDPLRAAVSDLTERVSDRARRRIALRASPRAAADHFSVDRRLIAAIRRHALRIRRVSRYLNAISADVAVGEIPSIAAQPFVVGMSRVAVLRREAPYEGAGDRSMIENRDGTDPLRNAYGGSLGQLDQIEAVELLEMGYDGSGRAGGGEPVLICLLDTGFDLGHEALRHVAVEAQWDFVQNDSITADEDGDLPGQERHGTAVLGALAGHHEGDLIGPAHGARYLLAKTEIEGTETRIEEDNWIAAVEWADSAGADVVSSSLGYVDWYDPSDMDGNTALCTRAADIAVSRGIVVVNSAGNGGTWGGLTPPADGDSVIAVGAVYRDGSIVSFSSRGPTADGRIKPDLVAPGYLVHSVEWGTADRYAGYSGTSMAAPLVAGLCALLIEIHPDWGPMEVRERILATATSGGEPDNTYGHGVPRGLAASGLDPVGIPDSPLFSIAYPNPFRETTTIELLLPESEAVTALVYDCRGMLVRTLVDGVPLKWRWTLAWDGTNNAGRRVAGGVYFLVVRSLRARASTKVLYVP